MNNKKFFGVASLVISLLSLIPVVISPDSLTGAEIFVVIGIILAIVGVVFGFIGKSLSKGLSISGIVIGFISCILLCFTLIGLTAIKNATDCVDNGNKTSTCSYLGTEIEAPNSLLRDDQMRK